MTYSWDVHVCIELPPSPPRSCPLAAYFIKYSIAWTFKKYLTGSSHWGKTLIVRNESDWSLQESPTANPVAGRHLRV